MSRKELAEIRKAVAEYIRTEGCTCCQSIDKHQAAKSVLAKLLHVPKYSDGSGWDFGKFREKV